MKKIDKLLRRNSTSSVVDDPETNGSEEESEGQIMLQKIKPELTQARLKNRRAQAWEEGAMIKNFVKNAALVIPQVNLLEVQPRLQQFVQKAKDGTLNDRELQIALLDIFPEIDALRPPQFLAKLFYSKYFRSQQSNEMRLDPVKFIIFLIFISGADTDERLDGLIFLFNIELIQDRIEQQSSILLTETILQMASCDLFQTMNDIKYTKESVYTQKEFHEMHQNTLELADYSMKQIFEGQEHLTSKQFEKALKKNQLLWLLDPSSIALKVLNVTKMKIKHRNMTELKQQNDRFFDFQARASFENIQAPNSGRKAIRRIKTKEQSSSSSSDEAEPFHIKIVAQVNMDDLLEYQNSLPLSKTPLADVLQCIERLKNDQEGRNLVPKEDLVKLFKDNFQSDEDWQQSFQRQDINMSDFLGSSMLKDYSEANPTSVDLRRLKLFAEYTCKQQTGNLVCCKAVHIGIESSNEEQPYLLEKTKFLEVVQLLCGMASINFHEALVSMGQIEANYTQVETLLLNASIKEISQDLTNEIFDEDEKFIHQQDWLNLSENPCYEWFRSFPGIRNKLFESIEVEPKHKNGEVVKKRFKLLKIEQDRIIEKAQNDEQQRKMKDEAVLAFQMKKNLDQMNSVIKELEEPENYQAQEQFLPEDKFAIIIANEVFSKSWIGMHNLPDVRDDLNNIMQTVRMMGIPKTNTFSYLDINYDQIEELYADITLKILARTKELTNQTGILGYGFGKAGFLWQDIKKFALQSDAPVDEIIIELDQKDQAILADLKAKEASGTLSNAEGSKKVFNVMWKKLKAEVMNDQDSKQIRIKLDKYQQILYQRYIEAERQEPNFIKNGSTSKFNREVFIIIYMAGHGCADAQQYFLLNEKQLSKIFWPAEYKNRKMLDRCGPRCKMFAVYDCCREELKGAQERIKNHQEKMFGILLNMLQNSNERQAQIEKEKAEEERKAKEEAEQESKHSIKEAKNESPEESETNKIDDPLDQQTRGGEGQGKGKSSNYISIHGTRPGALVDAKSKLAVEITQHIILSATNLRYEIVIPDCFITFRGTDMKNAITNETSRYSLKIFGQSEYDKASEKLFKEYGRKVQSQNNENNTEEFRTYVEMFLEYKDSIQALDKPLQWAIVDPENNQRTKRRRKLIRDCFLNKILQDCEITEQSDSDMYEDNFIQMPVLSTKRSTFQRLNKKQSALMSDKQPEQGLKRLKQIGRKTLQEKENAQNKFTACVFGECGQGKSTILNKVADILANKYYEGNVRACTFKSMKSYQSVTPFVQTGTVGDVTLIDTPGFNDCDVNRSDKKIFIEMVHTLRQVVKDPQQGISCFIQCIMPNSSHRFRESSLKTMNYVLFSLNCFNKNSDIYYQPKLIVIFNDVSRYGNDYDPRTIKEDSVEKAKQKQIRKQRIDEYKCILKEIAKSFYMHMNVSDETIIGDEKWKSMKEEVLTNNRYKQKEWYRKLAYYEKELVEEMKEIQRQIGKNQLLEIQPNWVKAKFIEDRIDDLFPNENFFFFKVFNEETGLNKLRNEIETEHLIKLIDNNRDSERYYLENGQFEPVQLVEDERELLIESMQISLQNITQEVIKSMKITKQVTKEENNSLRKRLVDTVQLQTDFGNLLIYRPQILQKCSFHGMILAKEIIAKARDEINELCMQDLAQEIKNKEKEISANNHSTELIQSLTFKNRRTISLKRQSTGNFLEDLNSLKEVSQSSVVNRKAIRFSMFKSDSINLGTIHRKDQIKQEMNTSVGTIDGYADMKSNKGSKKKCSWAICSVFKSKKRLEEQVVELRDKNEQFENEIKKLNERNALLQKEVREMKNRV